ncbi:hypothetical protein C4577_02505 [Candidatus Parcubacteria bacterium]|nr:MAG: hypothetical protein C4577_02505 [Candidatus Parcubacteria bacterium]
MKRRTKRTFKKFFYLLIIVISVVVIAFLFYNFKSIPLELSLNTNSSTIIRPYKKINNIDDFEKKMKDENIFYEYIRVETAQAGYSAKIKEGPLVYFSRNRDADFQIYSLQTILTRLTIENKRPQVIDLRLSKPIVKF